MPANIRLVFGIFTMALAGVVIMFFVSLAHGQQPSLREWFNSLQSPAGGVCCHNFDGISLEEDNWRTANGRYEVFVHGAWIEVPPLNVVTVPNRLGRAHLWLRPDGTVRCFMPGALS